ncbi:MAG: 4-phosphopantoate--beta-alanine ligase, partial [Candidatus Bathyarchaeota archaeon]|nr:4-phosphopantoate--beta-alanine ligase [Candidatus Bathyarchaeota archaeon]
HPRVESLEIREKLVEAFRKGIVAHAGLIAHGRGEAFDYILGEKTNQPAKRASRAAAAMLLTADKPVISVNGNTAALVANDVVRLANELNAEIEVNLFYRTTGREAVIESLLKRAGAKSVLGVDEETSARIPELGSERRLVDSRGILVADVVLIPLEDGDRAEALVRMGKKVIAVDLNPLSRTSQKASITIVDNIVRTMSLLVKKVQSLKNYEVEELETICQEFDNSENLRRCIGTIRKQLSELTEAEFI